ncbi:UDP-glucose/GDP-mannose dehydrogenase family protein [Aureimonas sp. ME7]|uniref:UDP-glucose dehydrogenase family protein n=1 Tax=Aureimonas sp. ME7 TaxID=2744252 RepID=UPI0015FA21AE|nr:UDP-glucose/GDP-mannose dehydrogenase family protein [Aureimonas sp. ME7]
MPNASPARAATKVAVIGTGYVGLVTGTCLAEIGCEVVCVDRLPEKIAALQSGRVPFYEPGLDTLVLRNVEAGRLAFTTSIGEAVAEAEVVIIAVGTPTRKLDGNADLQYVYAASREIAAALDHFAVIVTKSTVPVGTGAEVRRLVSEANPSLDFEVASNPEFLREGNAVSDFMKPDRIVVGTESERGLAVLRRLYSHFTESGFELIETDIKSSELIKYASNTFLATKVSFINEMADICENVGGDIEAISRGMGADKRIGHAFLRPGPGYGGSCFPKDTLAMVHIGERALSPATIVETVISVNRSRPHRMVAKVVRAASGEVRGATIALLGLTFKPETDDVRDSVALIVAEQLSQMGARVRAYDPKGTENAKSVLGDCITYCDDLDSAMQGADLCVIATEWQEFADKTPAYYRDALTRSIVVDLRNVYRTEDMEAAGVAYHSIGRPASAPASAAVEIGMRAVG